jgi:hypothetical protein
MATKRPFIAQVGRTSAGSFRISLRVADPKNSVSYRQRSIAAYKLAAEMERRIEKLGVGWVVSPEVFDGRIVLELTDRDDEQAASRFATKLLSDKGLA